MRISSVTLETHCRDCGRRLGSVEVIRCDDCRSDFLGAENYHDDEQDWRGMDEPDNEQEESC